MQLFWRKGYTATSIEDLLEALNLSRSSLYDTFGDKHSLFLVALKTYSERVISNIAKTLNESPSPIVAIQSLFDDLIAGLGTESGARGCFMVNSIAELVPYDPEVTEIAAAYSKRVQDLLSKALTKAISEGKLSSKEPAEALAVYIFNSLQGLRILIKTGASQKQIQAIHDISLNSLQ